MYDLDALRREEFPMTENNFYFNNATIAPLPVSVRDGMAAAMDALAEQPGDYFLQAFMLLFESVQAQAAAFINADGPGEIVPVATTSAALNAFAQSLDLESGDNVCFADVEFPSNAFPWLSLERDGVEARQIPADNGGLTVEALDGQVDGRTRVVAVSAVQFFTGHRADLAALGRFCRQREILFVVDAIQAIGHIPIDVKGMNIDVLATGGQKSLLCAPGIGFMYVREGVCQQLRPRMIGSNATVDFKHWLDYDLTFRPGADRFMSGTPNVIGIAGLQRSLDLITELGRENIDAHTRELTAAAAVLLTDQGYKVITPLDSYGPIVTAATGLTEADTDALVSYLKTRNVTAIKHLDRAGEPYIRLSFHCFNTPAEIEAFGEVLEGFLLSEGPDW